MTIESKVPMINIHSLLSGESSEECIAEIGNAARDWGFFYIQNHGIKPDLISAFRQDMDEFFHLPEKTLDNIRRTQENSRGYFDDELTKNKLDWKRCFDFGAQDGKLDNKGLDGFNQWPLVKEHATFERTMKEYFHQMQSLSEVLLSAFCRSLDMDRDALHQHFDGNHTSYLRLNYYPKCPNPDENLAIHHHTDAGALTILYQDPSVTSLQVFRDGKWYFIPPREGTFVINIGDMMQVWSNDKYKAPLHQVQSNSEHERYSAPFFYNPAYKSNVEPLISSCKQDYAKYNAINWGEFRGARFAGDYADVGEEVQISHFKIDSN